MVDVHSKATRSKNMSAIRAVHTKPEITVRRALHAMGFRFRLHSKNLLGKPDIILPKYKVVIFVNGCFWHKHECDVFRLPSTRKEWWDKKLTGNRLRDESVQDKLREIGWRVIVIWECALKGSTRLPPAELYSYLGRWIKNTKSNYVEIPEPA